MGLDLTGVGSIADLVKDAINKLWPDKTEVEKEKFEQLAQTVASDLQAELKGLDIVKAEAEGKGWLQNNWRPLLMLMFTIIVANNYIIYPYLAMFGVEAKLLELPEQLWGLLKIGVGGYVVGRSAEKIAGTLTGSSLTDVFKKS